MRTNDNTESTKEYFCCKMHLEVVDPGFSKSKAPEKKRFWREHEDGTSRMCETKEENITSVPVEWY